MLKKHEHEKTCAKTTHLSRGIEKLPSTPHAPCAVHTSEIHTHERRWAPAGCGGDLAALGSLTKTQALLLLIGKPFEPPALPPNDAGGPSPVYWSYIKGCPKQL